MSTKPEIIFDVKDVNISDIMNQIHTDMESRGYDIDEMKNLSKNLEIKPTFSTNGGNSQLNGFAAAVNSTNNIQYWWIIPSQGGIKGKLLITLVVGDR